MRILAIIPAYNEEACLERSVRALLSACPGIDYVVVNDGSTDTTGRICDQLGLDHVDHPRNLGITAAFHTGVRVAIERGCDAVVQYDADGQHVPGHIRSMADAMEREHADVVIGSRALAGCPPKDLRRIGQAVIGGLILATSGLHVTDPTSGLRLYGPRAMEAFARDESLRPEPDAMAILARRGMRIVEVPARMQDRAAGTSYLSPVNAARYMARTVASLCVTQWLR